MQFPSRYALLVAGPLSMWSVGCSSVSHTPVAQAAAAQQAASGDRLLSMAQVYEQKGQLEQAHKLYLQVLQNQPNHPVAREHAATLMAAMSNASAPKSFNEPADATSVASKSSEVSPSTVAPAPTDPALLGSAGRKKLSDAEVAARIPKQRKPAGAAQIATVQHSETNAGKVTPAQEFQPASGSTGAVVIIESPITVVEPTSLPPAQPLPIPAATAEVAVELPAPPSQATPFDFAPATIVQQPTTIVVESAKASTWVATSATRLCPDASPVLRALLLMLNAPSIEDRKAALEEIVNCSDSKVAAPAVRACLSDADPMIRAHAAWALWNITGECSESVTSLCRTLTCGQEETVVFACYVLGTMGHKAHAAADSLGQLQDSDSHAIRVHASEALLKVTDHNGLAVRVLTASLASHRADERSLAADALGSAVGTNRQAAIPALIAALKDSDPSVRCSAALALGGFGAEATSACSALQLAAANGDGETRSAAETALSCIRK